LLSDKERVALLSSVNHTHLGKLIKPSQYLSISLSGYINACRLHQHPSIHSPTVLQKTGQNFAQKFGDNGISISVMHAMDLQ
jgi:hypothetical protein